MSKVTQLKVVDHNAGPGAKFQACWTLPHSHKYNDVIIMIALTIAAQTLNSALMPSVLPRTQGREPSALLVPDSWVVCHSSFSSVEASFPRCSVGEKTFEFSAMVNNNQGNFFKLPHPPASQTR